MNLLVLNYSMDLNSLVFSHQPIVAKRLATNFEKTFVISSDNILSEDFAELVVRSSNWQRGHPFRNAISYYKLVLPLLFSHRKRLVIFSHMTEVQSFLIAPICRLLGIPHFLWYAHKNKSKYLRLSFPFLTGVITSTPGSCPINGPKVYPIGQAIDEKLFSSTIQTSKNPPLRWYHIGRMDQSKNIVLIIEVFQKLRNIGWEITLDLFGDISSESSRKYLDRLSRKYFTLENSNWLTFHGAIQRGRIPTTAQLYDGFVHAFQGSLDKAVLEAAMCKRLVVSINPEFESEFGTPDLMVTNLTDKLFLLMISSLELSAQEQRERINNLFNKTVQNHSLETWLLKLMAVISDEEF